MRKAAKPPPLAAAVSITLAVLLVWPTWTAARNGLSDIHARPAINYLEQKRFGAYAVSMAQWQAIQASILTAHDLMPGNPRYLESLGWLNQLHLALFADELSIEQQDALAAGAMRYFQQAIDNRPAWPYYWANLTMEHYRQGDYRSEDYSRALANTSRFGPWKNDAQRLVFDLGTETWNSLSPDAHRELVLHIERGLHRQPRNTAGIVQSHAAWPSVCTAAAAKTNAAIPHLQALCAQRGLNFE